MGLWHLASSPPPPPPHPFALPLTFLPPPPTPPFLGSQSYDWSPLLLSFVIPLPLQAINNDRSLQDSPARCNPGIPPSNFLPSLIMAATKGSTCILSCHRKLDPRLFLLDRQWQKENISYSPQLCLTLFFLEHVHISFRFIVNVSLV